jgi:hypothetical protein
MLAIWTGTTYQFSPPEWLFGAAELPVVSVLRSSGESVYIKYPIYRLAVLGVAVAIMKDGRFHKQPDSLAVGGSLGLRYSA